jgi:hypothetical protein
MAKVKMFMALAIHTPSSLDTANKDTYFSEHVYEERHLSANKPVEQVLN